MTKYYYNAKSQLAKEIFYQNDELSIDAVTINKYNSNGNLRKKRVINNLNPKHERRSVYKYLYTFW